MTSLSNVEGRFSGAENTAPRKEILRHQGVVLHGAKLGRTIGFPTANLSLGVTPGPARGIYAARARTADGALHDAVAYFGARPTVDGIGDLLEVFLFDFDEQIYGSTLAVVLLAFVRRDETFPGLDAMKVQIARDCTAARQVLDGWPDRDVDF
ncbi:hypothetical protein BH10PSE4_BH10PSE4_00890 [soil metagenome]